MSQPLPVEVPKHPAKVVVHPVVAQGDPRPFRRVDILGAYVGKAYGLTDVIEIMRRAGVEDGEIDDSALVDWRGGGPGVWT